ncbi:MAG: RNA polymerase sigma factor [Thermoleophilia bacterium]|nr:RNA polymerase sigma factor [Thermoleophilia bacterium]
MFRRDHSTHDLRLARPDQRSVAQVVHVDDADGVVELVELAAGGDESAFADIYTRFAAHIYRYALARCGERELAEDVVAETFLAAWRRIPTYVFTGAPFVTWLLAIANRHHATTIRTRARKPTTRLETDHTRTLVASGADVLSLLASRDEVERLLARLPHAQRQVLELRFLIDLTAEDTALVLGTTSANVRQLQLRALQRLRCHYLKADAA